VKNRSSKLLLLLSVCISLSACKKDPLLFSPYDETISIRTINKSEFIGLWVIDDISLDFVHDQLGFEIYTNRNDHVLLLNEDGSCVFTYSSALYFNKFMRSNIASGSVRESNSDDQVEHILTDRPFLLEDPAGCYVWFESSSEYPYVKGPYSTLNNNHTAKHIIYKRTLWSKWKISQNHKSVDYEDFSEPFNWKYAICLQQNLSTSSINLSIYVGKDSYGIYLGIPVVANPNQPLYRVIKYRKS